MRPKQACKNKHEMAINMNSDGYKYILSSLEVKYVLYNQKWFYLESVSEIDINLHEFY